MSRSHVKGHRRGGVCVLRMLLVYAISKHLQARIYDQLCEKGKFDVVFTPKRQSSTIHLGNRNVCFKEFKCFFVILE